MPSVTQPRPVTQFRPRRHGPEALIQDIVAGRIPELFSPSEHSWTGASVPLGAGIPDLVVVSYKPQVFALPNIELSDAQILAYLRAVGKARLETIAQRMGKSPKKLIDRLDCLVEASAIETSSKTFSLTPPWRQILPEIITIEVKVSHWKRALEQAARNKIFAHLSLVALPEKIAARVRTEALFSRLGVGLISVSDDGTAAVIRKARRTQPTVWTYYYQLASLLAKSRPN
jgi:DNA-binding Lrp family transcriptional regulator